MGYGIWDMGYGIWDMGYGICGWMVFYICIIYIIIIIVYSVNG
jgi:hypothetical protein